MTFSDILGIIPQLLLIPGLIEYLTTNKPKPKLIVEIFSAEPKILKQTLEFYIENVGDEATELDSEIDVSYECADGSVEHLSLSIKENDRALPSFTKRKFLAIPQNSQLDYSSLRVVRYTFSEANGRQTLLDVCHDTNA